MKGGHPCLQVFKRSWMSKGRTADRRKTFDWTSKEGAMELFGLQNFPSTTCRPKAKSNHVLAEL
jgi:hypothetical protein